MKTYIISLKNSIERREAISQQAAMAGLDFVLTDAVYGKELPKELLSILKAEHSYAITPGEIGCSLSHLNVYKELLHSEDDFALVLEDDVIVPANTTALLNALESTLSKDKPCICLLSKVNHYNRKKQITLADGQSVHEVFNAAFSHAYVVNRKAAENLLKNLLPIWCVADQWPTFQEFGFIRLSGVIPACINTHPEFEKITTIEDRDDQKIQKDKDLAWAQIQAQRPFSVKLRKALHLMFYRPFQKVIKQ